jgi:diapolycopene oxygenase
MAWGAGDDRGRQEVEEERRSRMQDRTMKVGVIGSGLAGLAAACTLAARGHSVEVFEKNPWLGGKAAQLQEQGFRFDMGPTILIQPSVLRKVFEEAGRRMEDYVPMARLDPQWRCFFDDGKQMDLKDNAEQMAASLDAVWPQMGAGYLKFLESSKQLHSISERFFFWRSIGRCGIRLTWEERSIWRC